ncbi:MAG TPA: EamA family transporter [Ktedonobacterales bacterium]|nr:EamA family transporter [Ktedonobacterales bacterium]
MRDSRRLTLRPSSGLTRRAVPSLLGRVPPSVLILLSMTSTQIGAALATHLFGIAGPGGTVLLRIGFAALILMLSQGGLPARALHMPRRAYVPVVLFGLTLACMNFSFYSALDRLPLGIAVTIEFIGPLGVAVAGSRRALDFVWVALAAGGILLFAPWTGARLDPFGVLLALVAGALWACYILLSARVGRTFPGSSGLALAMSIGALAILPVGVVSAGTTLLSPLVLLAGCAVALLSSAVPYSLEIEALRRMPTHVFGIMMSLEPAVAALVGLLLLAERLSARDIAALALVTAAMLGVTLGNRRGASAA